MRLRILLAVAFGLGLSLSASAQDVMGTVTGTIEDLPASWSIGSGDGQSSGVWVNMGPGMDIVTFFAQADADVGPSMLNLSFGMMRAAGTMTVFNAEGYFRYLDTAMAYSAPMDEGIQFTLTLVEEVEAGLHVQGTFSGDFFLSAITGDVDQSQSITIAGAFDMIVPPN